MTTYPASPGQGNAAARLPAAGAVLAGGASRRMGRDKASLPWRGRPLGVFVAERLAAWFEAVIVAADRPGPFAGTPFPVVPDRYPGLGTLGGLHGALAASPRDWVFLAACDMPFLVEGLARRLWTFTEGHDAVVCRREGRFEPLGAFYHRRCLGAAARALEAGERRVVSFFEAVRVREVEEAEWRDADPAGDSFRNLNTPDAYRTEGGAGEAVYGPPGTL
jgi:molybdopterin-guanine dinucleotide biosynthesis protein A